MWTDASALSLKWSSSNPSIASVSSTGQFTARNLSGTTTITVSSVSNPSLSTSFKLQVVPSQMAVSVRLSSSKIQLKVGDTQQLTATLNPNPAYSSYRVAWKSTNENVLRVDYKGNVLAVGKGTASITVTTIYGRYHALSMSVS